MALEWGKEISFSGLRKRQPKAKAVYPEKTYINLVVQDKKEFDLRRTLPIAIVVIVVAALFLKFGVWDFFDRVNQKEAELHQEQQVLSGLQAQLTSYSSVQEEYEAYDPTGSAAASDTVSTSEALALVDRFIRPSANVANVSIDGNTVALELTNISLDSVGKLVSTLYEQSIVANVTVSTAGTQGASTGGVTTAMVITLQRA